MNGVVRRRMMNKPEEKGPIINVYDLSFNVSAHSSNYYYYFFRNFVVGATYTFNIDATGVRIGSINGGIQNNGDGPGGAPTYRDKRIFNITVTRIPSPSRGQIAFGDGCKAGRVTFILTETIPRT
jgi:hypothetical protein